MKKSWTKYIVILSGFFLIGLGLLAFFIPDQLSLFFRQDAGSELLIQLYGAALMGFGFANWHNRHSPMGGIYGRAIVTGNIIHFLSGTGILLGLILGEQQPAGVLILSAGYMLLAVGYIAVLFRGGIVSSE